MNFCIILLTDFYEWCVILGEKKTTDFLKQHFPSTMVVVLHSMDTRQILIFYCFSCAPSILFKHMELHYYSISITIFIFDCITWTHQWWVSVEIMVPSCHCGPGTDSPTSTQHRGTPPAFDFLFPQTFRIMARNRSAELRFPRCNVDPEFLFKSKSFVFLFSIHRVCGCAGRIRRPAARGGRGRALVRRRPCPRRPRRPLPHRRRTARC